MASTLLFEAWLVGKNVLSIQPESSNNPLGMMEHKEGAQFINKYDNAEKLIVKWFSKLTHLPEQKFKTELEFHKNASNRVIHEILNLR